jgi:hypothetical protein
MTWQADLLSLAQMAAGANPTAAIVLDFLDGVLALYDQATTPNLSAELASADAAGSAAEDVKFPPEAPTTRLRAPTPPGMPPQPPIVNLTNEGLAVTRQVQSECAATGHICPETALAMVRNSLAMTKELRTGGASVLGAAPPLPSPMLARE